MRRELGVEQILEVEQDDGDNESDEKSESDNERCLGAVGARLRVWLVDDFPLRCGDGERERVLLAFLQQESVEGVLYALLAVEVERFAFLSRHAAHLPQRRVAYALGLADLHLQSAESVVDAMLHVGSHVLDLRVEFL